MPVPSSEASIAMGFSLSAAVIASLAVCAAMACTAEHQWGTLNHWDIPRHRASPLKGKEGKKTKNMKNKNKNKNKNKKTTCRLLERKKQELH